MLLVSPNVICIENEAVLLCVTMQERERAFAATIYCITFWYNFCIVAIKKSGFRGALLHICHYQGGFCGALFKYILAWERGISKRYFLQKKYSSPLIFHLPYSSYRGVFFCVKIKVFHSCRTRVVCVALLSLSCRTRVAHVWHLFCKIN